MLTTCRSTSLESLSIAINGFQIVGMIFDVTQVWCMKPDCHNGQRMRRMMTRTTEVQPPSTIREALWLVGCEGASGRLRIRPSCHPVQTGSRYLSRSLLKPSSVL